MVVLTPEHQELLHTPEYRNPMPRIKLVFQPLDKDGRPVKKKRKVLAGEHARLGNNRINVSKFPNSMGQIDVLYDLTVMTASLITSQPTSRITKLEYSLGFIELTPGEKAVIMLNSDIKPRRRTHGFLISRPALVVQR